MKTAFDQLTGKFDQIRKKGKWQVIGYLQRMYVVLTLYVKFICGTVHRIVTKNSKDFEIKLVKKKTSESC